jgi:hypothetical protein
MKIYLKSGQTIRIRRSDAVEIFEIMKKKNFKEVDYFKISYGKIISSIVCISEIACIK